MPFKPKKDLIVLVADATMGFTVLGMLQQPRRLGIRSVAISREDVPVHPAQDTGCFRRCNDFLRAFSHSYEHAIVMLDREGCGKEQLSREELEEDIEDRLRSNGWDDRAMAIVFEPELEIWVWSNSPQVDEILGWKGNGVGLRQWLKENDFLKPAEIKPARPKEALQAVLRETSIPFSSSIHFNLARSVGFSRCTDPAFVKFRNKLKQWFPET
jgi:hypothetical protein